MSIFKKKTIVEEVVDQSQKIQPELKELVIGRKTILSLLSFGVGSVMIGNFIWNLTADYFGHALAGTIGLILFLIGGVIRHEFKK